MSRTAPQDPRRVRTRSRSVRLQCQSSGLVACAWSTCSKAGIASSDSRRRTASPSCPLHSMTSSVHRRSSSSVRGSTRSSGPPVRAGPCSAPACVASRGEAGRERARRLAQTEHRVRQRVELSIDERERPLRRQECRPRIRPLLVVGGASGNRGVRLSLRRTARRPPRPRRSRPRPRARRRAGRADHVPLSQPGIGALSSGTTMTSFRLSFPIRVLSAAASCAVAPVPQSRWKSTTTTRDSFSITFFAAASVAAVWGRSPVSGVARPSCRCGAAAVGRARQLQVRRTRWH